MVSPFRVARLCALAVLPLLPVPGWAQGSGDASDLAKQLSNPVSSLISVPFQWNYDQNLGLSDDGEQRYLRFQPVVPVSLNDDWNLIARAIVTYFDQTDVTGPGESQEGFGDTSLSFFFSPKAATASGWIWGVGPVAVLPSYDDTFSTDQWGAGVTGVALRQQGEWTYGMLASQTWGINPPDGEDAFSALYLQPFLVYTTPTAWSFGVNSESTYNWNTEQWSAPVNAFVSKVVKIGNQPISLSAGVRQWFDNPEGGAEGTGYRLTATFMFPK